MVMIAIRVKGKRRMSPVAERAKRIVEVYGETDVAPEKRLREKDRKRAVNYKYYTDEEWGKAKQYHLTLDSSVFGIEGCAQLIAELSQKV